jgi:hypothetical protein
MLGLWILESEIMLRPERVAQPVEHVTFNHGVLGSSPSALTKNIDTSKAQEYSGTSAIEALKPTCQATS